MMNKNDANIDYWTFE